jgi:membrane-associated phospholipid phosphatase
MLGLLDRHVAMEVTESNSDFAQGLARDAEHGGNPAVILPLIGVTWVAGKVSGHPGVSSSSLRIAGGLAAPAVVADGLKIVTGRSRPYQAPGDPDDFHLFSGNTSFPSGHTSIAFSLASGIDHETTAHWVPFVVYPLAGLVGWSRLRDNDHWASDVLAGALIGTWTTHNFQVLVRVNKPHSAVSLEIAPGAAAATYHCKTEGACAPFPHRIPVRLLRNDLRAVCAVRRDQAGEVQAGRTLPRDQLTAVSPAGASPR